MKPAIIAAVSPVVIIIPSARAGAGEPDANPHRLLHADKETVISVLGVFTVVPTWPLLPPGAPGRSRDVVPHRLTVLPLLVVAGTVLNGQYRAHARLAPSELTAVARTAPLLVTQVGLGASRT